MTVALKNMDAEFLLSKAIQAFKKKGHDHPGDLGNLRSSASLTYNGHRITILYSRLDYTHKFIIAVYDRQQTKKLLEYSSSVGLRWVPIWEVPAEIQAIRPVVQFRLTQTPTFETQFSNINDWKVTRI